MLTYKTPVLKKKKLKQRYPKKKKNVVCHAIKALRYKKLLSTFDLMMAH